MYEIPTLTNRYKCTCINYNKCIVKIGVIAGVPVTVLVV